MKTINYSNFQYQYNLGLSDVDAAKVLNCSKRTVGNWREKNNLPPNVISSREKFESWSKEKFILLHEQGLTDKKIADVLFIQEASVSAYRRKLGLKSNQSHNINITKDMEEILVGTLLGDGNINCISKSKIKKFKDTGILTFAHSTKQKEYCFYKYKKLISLFNREPKFNQQIRKGKINESYYAISKSSVSLKKYWSIFYKEGEKIIPPNIEEYFTKQSLAYLFMDDGCRSENVYTIALCSFSEESLDNLQSLLLKWDIETNILKNHILYIKAKSRNNFIEAITQYIIPEMRYKCPYKIL